MSEFNTSRPGQARTSLACEIVAHHLRLMGLPASKRIAFFDRPSSVDAELACLSARTGNVCVVLQPESGFAQAIGASVLAVTAQDIQVFDGLSGPDEVPVRLRTLHAAQGWFHPEGLPVLTNRTGHAIWLWVPVGEGGYLILGTDLAGDLLRFRQGDPERAKIRPTEAQWGIAGERPNYLFEDQLAGVDGYERQADWWAMALAETLSEKIRRPLSDILPGGAPGAIVITGDDDQAYLEKYNEQLRLLGDTPITYLLHPLTRNTNKTLRAMQRRNPGVDFGIHPDALEAPERYSELFEEQVAWYQKLTGTPPLSLRNHGFLNDGYWGHLQAWLNQGVKMSSNLPGFDGRILNGSLLPARMVWNGSLTLHWSVLTVIGDGVRFSAGMSDEDAAKRLYSVADGIRESRIPGVMVLNLHPQNVSETQAMHHAAKEIIRSGFVAWNLRQCWEWFARIDRSDGPRIEPTREQAGLLQRLWHRSIRGLVA